MATLALKLTIYNFIIIMIILNNGKNSFSDFLVNRNYNNINIFAYLLIINIKI